MFIYPPPCLRHAWRVVSRAPGFSAEIPQRALKVTEVTFTKKSHWKWLFLLVAHQPDLLGKGFAYFNLNTVPEPNVAKTQGGDPPPAKVPSPLGRPGRTRNLSFFLRCSNLHSETCFVADVVSSTALGPQKGRLGLPFGSLLGASWHQIGGSGLLAITLLFIMFSPHGATPGMVSAVLQTALQTWGCREHTFCPQRRPPVDQSNAQGHQRNPNMVPNGPQNRPEWTPKSLTNAFCDIRACQGVLGYPPRPPKLSKIVCFWYRFCEASWEICNAAVLLKTVQKITITPILDKSVCKTCPHSSLPNTNRRWSCRSGCPTNWWRSVLYISVQ